MRCVIAMLLACSLGACNGDGPGDPNVVPKPDRLKEDRSFISPPTLQFPIYQCGSSVVVKNFIPGAELNVFADGNPTPIGTAKSWLSTGQNIKVSITFTAGQIVTATQTFDGVTSAPSNAVTVTSHLEDYLSGLPPPWLAPTPLFQCGRAVGIRDAVPSALVKVFAENPAAGGGFDPPVQVGAVSDFGYTLIGPAFVRDARVWAEQALCTDTSPRSPVEIVQPEPASISGPTLDPVYEGVNIVTVWGPGGNPSPLVNGATLDVFAGNLPPGNQRIGGQPTPGGGQQVFINPAGQAAVDYWATQGLCTTSPPGQTTTGLPCSELPAPKIKPPLPGDTQIEVTEYVPGARILVFANGEEVGDSGPTVINLSRALVEGETIVVVQRIGKCDSSDVYQIRVACESLGGDANACSGDWPMFRHSGLRDAQQVNASALSDPYQVKKLGIQWQFPPSGSAAVGAFRASPVVWKGRVYVGSSDGHLYALDAATGKLLWQYPAVAATALDSQFHSNPSSFGLASSAAIAVVERRDLVIFGAPDPSIGKSLGSGRLFALDAATGAEVWKSPEIAVLSGTTASSTTELHEQIGYSSPLVLGNRVYIGIANHGDNPIQNGRVAAVDLASGAIVGGFSFTATATRGGGVWSSVAGGLEGGGVYVTTGNTRCWNGGCQSEPSPNHGLSLLRLNPASGALTWKLQPVPFDLDGDPDWASGPSLMAASCGHVAASTMKDGWTYAVRAAPGSGGSANVLWQFPPTGLPFTSGDGTVHGDSRYLIPGAAWSSVFITTNGGEQVIDSTSHGFNRLHALNVCAGRGSRVRWVVDVPSTTAGSSYQLGPPSVTRGIVYVGTAQGHLVALADPSAWPSAGSRCSNPAVANTDCLANGFQLVPLPKVLLDLNVGGSMVRNEPALAGNRVFLATGAGRVFMLEPKK
jgi:outer membrane protein assembly factor BamB